MRPSSTLPSTTCPRAPTGVLRLDADEIVFPELAQQIARGLGGFGAEIAGVYVSRRMCFLGRPIRWGGVFPIRVLRLFRVGEGRCEERWMDEHILVEGTTAGFDGEILDDNLNSLGWWTDKHNAYASREVVDLLNLEYGFIPHETVADLTGGEQAGVKRWLKEKVYARLPGGLRALRIFCTATSFGSAFSTAARARRFTCCRGSGIATWSI